MANNQLPGYSGYARLYQRESTTPKVSEPSAHKYNHVAPAKKTLIEDSLYRSQYTEQTKSPAASLSSPTSAGPVSTQDLLLQRMLQEEKEAYEMRPTSHWTSTYKQTFDGDRTARSQKEVVEAIIQREGSSAPQRRSLELLNSADSGASQLLRPAQRRSTYKTEYGRTGETPLAHVEATLSERKDTAISATATGRDLFHGTTKAAGRIPNYDGYVPSTDDNLQRMVGEHPQGLKDNLIYIYRDTMAGYTGHRPRAVTNDKIVREALAPKGSLPKPVLSASIVVDSMKVQAPAASR